MEEYGSIPRWEKGRHSTSRSIGEESLIHKTPVLIVEDNPEDFEAIQRAFRGVGASDIVHRCTTGDEALDYLHRRGAYSFSKEAPRPGLIVLDLNLPGTPGRETRLDRRSRATSLRPDRAATRGRSGREGLEWRGLQRRGRERDVRCSCS